MLFSYWVVSDSLQLQGLQQARVLCPPLSPRVCSNSCPLSQWCYLTISSSAALFSFCLQSSPASFPVSHLFTSGGQNIGASASATVLPMNIQGWFPLGLTDLLAVLGTLKRAFSSTTIWKHHFFHIIHNYILICFFTQRVTDTLCLFFFCLHSLSYRSFHVHTWIPDCYTASSINSWQINSFFLAV